MKRWWVMAGAAGLFFTALAAWQVYDAIAVRNAAREAKRALDAGDYEAARRPLVRWRSARPRSADAQFQLARLAFALNEFELLFSTLDVAERLGYSRDEVSRLRAIGLARIGRHEEALPTLQRRFLASDRPDPELDEALARALIETFQFRAAVPVVERWTRDAPRLARAFSWKAEVARRLDAPAEEQVANYRQVLEREPDNSEALYHLGDLLLGVHEVEEARRILEQALTVTPDDPMVHLELGRCLAEQDDEPGSLRHLDRAVELAPRDSRVLTERARLELRAGRFEEALQRIDAAIAVDMSDPEPHYIRSTILTRLGRKDDAAVEQALTTRLRREKDELAALIEDLRQSPRDVEKQHDAARWLFEHGHPEEAQRWTDKIFQIQPQHSATHRLLADHFRKAGDIGRARYHEVQASLDSR